MSFFFLKGTTPSLACEINQCFFGFPIVGCNQFPRTIVVSVFSFQCKLLILMLNLIFLLDHDDHDSHFHSFSGSLLPWGPTFGHASVVQPVNL